MRWHLVLGISLTLCVAVSLGQNEAKTNQQPTKKVATGGTATKPASTAKSSNDKSGQHASLPEVPPLSQHASAAETTEAVDALTKLEGRSTLKKARILVMLPLPFFSHTNNFMPIFKELARRGHNITMVSPFPQEKPLPNWEDIVTENVMEKIQGGKTAKDMGDLTKSFISKVTRFAFTGLRAVEFAGQMAPVQELFKDKTREYDLVFVETQFVQEVMLAFGWKYKAPVISLFPSYIIPEVAYYTGNPVFTTNYVPNMIFQTSNAMNFYQRFENTAYTVLKLLFYNLYYIPAMDAQMRKYFPLPDLPYLGDLLFNVSFTLLDTNLALTYPYPRANNMREFLGINTQAQTPLPPELKTIMDGADEHGVILFTLGSHIKLSGLEDKVLSSLFYAFANIPQIVLMKWEKDEPPPNLSSNVHTMKWLPQAAILGHKNCKAFLTHTGVHGLIEAMDHAVPVIAFPVFADQMFFAKWAVENGVGQRLDNADLTPEIALKTIKEVVDNPKYKENAVGVSIKMKDLPLPTLDEVVYWVEHVLRTNGARHLRPGSLNLAWYQRFGLDVLLAALILVSVSIWVFIALLRCCCSKCKGTPKPAKSSSKKHVNFKKEN